MKSMKLLPLGLVLAVGLGVWTLAGMAQADEDGPARDEVTASLEAEAVALERQVQALLSKVKQASAAGRPSVERQLRQVLAEQFAAQQKLRQHEMEQLERRVEKLREALAERAENKDALIEQRLKKLLADPGVSDEPAGNPPGAKGAEGRTAGKNRPGSAQGATAENKPAGKSGKSGGGKGPRKRPNKSAEPAVVQIDLSQTEQITLANPGEWKLDLAAAPVWEGPLKTAPLPPKSNFFEKLNGVTVNRASGKAAVSFVLGEPKPTGTTRLVMCDLTTGKSTPPISVPVQMGPLAVHDDGEHVLMRREEWGFGNLNRLEVWKVSGSSIDRELVCTPYESDQGAGADIYWGEFISPSLLATSSRWGRVVLWKYPEMEPQCMFTLGDGCVPALSPDRKLIAYCNGSEIGLFDVEKRAVVAQQPTPEKLQWPMLAFSPSGQRVACVAFDKVLVWKTATGELVQSLPCHGLQVNGAIAFPDERFVLAGNQYLLDVENRIKLWTYTGPEQLRVVDGWSFFAVTNGEQAAGALLPLKLPHAGALTLLDKAINDPELFVLRTGTKVKLNTAAIADAGEREKAEAHLAKRLEAIGCQADPAGTIELVASVEGPKEREVSYQFSGDYKVQEWISRLRFVYQGQVAWEATSTNVPFFISLKKGENVAGYLRDHEKPDYHLFERAELPRFLQKPSGNGQGSSLTIGQSQVTVGGVK